MVIRCGGRVGWTVSWLEGHEMVKPITAVLVALVGVAFRSPVFAATPCPNLESLALPNLTVTLAELVPAGPFVNPGGGAGPAPAAAPAVPAAAPAGRHRSRPQQVQGARRQGADVPRLERH